MNVRLTLVTARRILTQVRADPRTIGLLLLVPCVLLGLLAWVYDGTTMFDKVGPSLLGLFPFVVMFIVTSVTTLRERSSGTMERLWTTPLGRGDLIAGYAVAFGVFALVQALLATAFAVWVCGLDVRGSTVQLVVVAVVDAVLGSTFGLAVSAFARTEFQAVQFMPALVLPQFLLCGLLTPRDRMPDVLHAISDVLPLSYAVDAMQTITARADGSTTVARDLGIMLAFVVAAIALGAATLQRRTP